MKRFTGVLFLALLAGGCPDRSPVGPSESVVTPSYGGYELLGRVFCENGQPLEIATVTASQSPASDPFNMPPYVEDGPEGYFVISNLSGLVSLYVHAPGHESVTRTVEMTSDKTISIELKMLD